MLTKKNLLIILTLSVFFLTLLLTKVDRRVFVFLPVIYATLKPPYLIFTHEEETKKYIVSTIILLVIYFIYWR